jgi:TetR/AcrR family transcriptional regulator, transcriptional repressor of aconitase
MQPGRSELPKVSKEYLTSRREEILDAALVSFARGGFHRTTMQDIVCESGLSPGAIYNYFKSKEEIVEAIANQRQSKEKRLIRDAVEAGPADRALERIRDAFLDELNDPRERLRRRVSVQLWAEAQRNQSIRRLVRRSFEEPKKLIAQVLSTAQKQGTITVSIDPDALASFLIAAFHGLVLQREWDDRFSSEAHKAIFDSLLQAAVGYSNAREQEVLER